MMQRREFITVLGGAAAWPAAALGQQSRRPWRIAFPQEGVASAGVTKRFDAFRNGLRELGYAEGDNIVIDRRDAGGTPRIISPTRIAFSRPGKLFFANEWNRGIPSCLHCQTTAESPEGPHQELLYQHRRKY